ncbi:glycosyltransferase family 39 protein [Chitinophaga sp. XS-30]|uniref:glycosyltransferase family 39 protein n=1 Tax=Chitinophaga sp. XS-30 TaxID=2604421 RepID=UPI0011DE0985|nr:glycosyltransferase family 39 protein [Chitinophaga sp. XS-30]QEH40456.1 glycosyltransferase family 39 protein [Chitinophaga sp. XS-30]
MNIADLSAWAKVNRLVVAALLIIFSLRIIFTGVMGLMPQDAYYYFYSEHPALSYYDHPPAIAWLLKAFTTVLGKEVFVIKLADTVTTLLTLFCFYRLARLFTSRHVAGKALLLLFPTLMITILSLVSTPDVPLMLCWTLTLLCLYHAVFRGKKMWWIWAGVMMGLAFDSKYTAVFLPFGLLLFLVFSAQYRRLLWSPWPWLCFLFMALLSSPVIIWNLQNDLASFRFQSSGRTGGIAFRPLDILGVIGHQAAILLPVLFFGLMVILYKTVRKYGLRIAAVPPKKLFLLCFFIPAFAGFFLISGIYWVKLNWMMPAYISGIIWASAYFSHKYIRWQQVAAVIVHLAMAVELLFYPVPVNSDDVWMGWGQMAGAVREVREQYPEDFVFSADSYKTSAVLNFYFDEMVYGENIIGEPALQFDYVNTDLNALKGRNALFVNSVKELGDEVDEKAFVLRLKAYFTSVEALPPVISKRGGKVVRKFLVYRCFDYHPEGVGK